MINELAPADGIMDSCVHQGVPQGLKPSLFLAVCGATEVVPCYRTKVFRGFERLAGAKLIFVSSELHSPPEAL